MIDYVWKNQRKPDFAESLSTAEYLINGLRICSHFVVPCDSQVLNRRTECACFAWPDDGFLHGWQVLGMWQRQYGTGRRSRLQ